MARLLRVTILFLVFATIQVFADEAFPSDDPTIQADIDSLNDEGYDIANPDSGKPADRIVDREDQALILASIFFLNTVKHGFSRFAE